MPDDLTNKGRKTEAASACWSRTKEWLSEAVRNVGHSAADVERELKKSA